MNFQIGAPLLASAQCTAWSSAPKKTRPPATTGEEVIAFVVAREGTTLDSAALDALCLKKIARFKRPRGYHVVEALPKNNTGKVLKTELRARLAQAPGAAEA